MDPQQSNRPAPDSQDDVVNDQESHRQRLARIKAQIESGEYETPEKLEIAVARMIGAMTD